MEFSLPSLNTLDLIIAASVFGLIFALWLIGFFLWLQRRSSRRQRLENRLGLLDQELEEGNGRVLRLWHEGEEATTQVLGGRRRSSLKQWLDRLARDAGMEEQLHSLILAMIGATAMGFLLLLFATQSVLPGLGWCLLAALGFQAYVKWRVGRRLARFDIQFVEALGLAARSLRAGHPLPGAFRLIAEEVTPPVSTVFHEIGQRQALGMSMEDALQAVTQEITSADFRIFATSVIIQIQTGGNLADMMERIQAVIRDRMRLSRRVRTLTTQSQFSKRILLAIPILMFFVLNLLNRPYMANLYDTKEGHILLATAGGAMLTATWIMNRLVMLRY
jgi:tight adherence protein B